MKKTNILIAEDHPILRKALIRDLKEHQEFNCFEAATGEEALVTYYHNPINVLLLDINMPRMNGITVAKEILRTSLTRNPKIIMFSVYNEPVLIFNLLQIGVCGYLSKDVEMKEVIDAIHFVKNDGVYYQKRHDEALKQLAVSKSPPTIDLTDIEGEIIRYLAQGKSSKDIAAETGYSQRTIESKRLVIEKKTLSKNSCELINYAYKNGILIIDSRS